jgi:hypothetical protein|tara:strand:+ start:44 stop:355 length:312 start_codon:yes stop_codon:yes gene_type:complete
MGMIKKEASGTPRRYVNSAIPPSTPTLIPQGGTTLKGSKRGVNSSVKWYADPMGMGPVISDTSKSTDNLGAKMQEGPATTGGRSGKTPNKVFKNQGPGGKGRF